MYYEKLNYSFNLKSCCFILHLMGSDMLNTPVVALYSVTFYYSILGLSSYSYFKANNLHDSFMFTIRLQASRVKLLRPLAFQLTTGGKTGQQNPFRLTSKD